MPVEGAASPDSKPLSQLQREMRFEKVYKSVMGCLSQTADVGKGGGRRVSRAKRDVTRKRLQPKRHARQSPKCAESPDKMERACFCSSPLFGQSPPPSSANYCPYPMGNMFPPSAPYVGVPALFQGHVFLPSFYPVPPDMVPPAQAYSCQPSTDTKPTVPPPSKSQDTPPKAVSKKKKKLSKRKASPAEKDSAKKPRIVLKIPRPGAVSKSNWQALGRSEKRFVYYNNDLKPVKRESFSAIRHKVHLEEIRVRDCVFVRSSNGAIDVAKIAHFFIDPDKNDLLTASLLWYYRPEQLQLDHPVRSDRQELFASRHIDTVPVDCIEDICYVVTYNEFLRYHAENLSEITYPMPVEIAARGSDSYVRRERQPAEDTHPDVVFFTKRVYDFAGKRLVRNPT